MTSRKLELLNVLTHLMYMALGVALFSVTMMRVEFSASAPNLLAFTKVGALLLWWATYLLMLVRLISLALKDWKFEPAWNLKQLPLGIFSGFIIPWSAMILDSNYMTYRHFGFLNWRYK